jgi:hypothetical protein
MGAKTVYYTTKVYKDMNSPRLRPDFKRVTNIYAINQEQKL